MRTRLPRLANAETAGCHMEIAIKLFDHIRGGRHNVSDEGHSGTDRLNKPFLFYLSPEQVE